MPPRFSRKPLLQALLQALLLGLFLTSTAHADYFLHNSQKADLIARGALNGEDGGRYDVWIVPGYVGPAQAAKTGWSNAGSDFAEYGHGDLYKDAGTTAKQALKFAGNKAIGQFALKGSYEAWGDAFDAASARTERGVFGWWFAYPWALIEATGESVVRVGLGVPGGILIGGIGSTILPVVEVAWPAVKGVYHSTIPGTVMPLAASGWNTVIAPPMALLGEQPNAQRADGFWVKRIEPAKIDPELIAAKSALAAWSRALVNTPEAKAVSEQQKLLNDNYDKKRDETLKQLVAQYNVEKKQLDQQWQHTLQQQVAQNEPVRAESIDQQKLRALVQRYGRAMVSGPLTDSGLSRDAADKLLTQLLGDDVVLSVAPSVVVSPQPVLEQRRDGDKTDPLKRSLELVAKQF
jgi:hypothetical protein